MPDDDPRPAKDRTPKQPGSARARMLLKSHCLIDPYNHQADGLACMLARFERHGAFGLLHDMGCGKTLTMLGGLLTLHDEGDASTMLVVCPSSVVGAWQRECEQLNLRAGETRVECLGLSQASVAKREAALQRCLLERDARRQGGEQLPPLVVATNYEGTWRMEATLAAARFEIVACDESQRIKAAGSKQSRAMYRIGKRARYRVLMTGTPIPEGGLDWYGQWRFADPELLGTNYGNFRARFALEIPCGNGEKSFRKYIVNPHTKDQLERMVMERSHRVSKEEAIDLPEQSDSIIEFDLEPRQRKVYDDLVRDSIALIQRTGSGGAPWDDGSDYGEIVGDNVLTRMLRLQQICGGYMQVDGDEGVVPCAARNPKLLALADLAETLRDAGRKLVIFHRFTHEGLAIEKLCSKLSGKGAPVSVINGSIKSSDRKDMIAEFQEGDATFFVGQIQACAEGITLHAASDTALYSMPFASAVYLQALARVHRIGQHHPVTHHHLIARGTIDQTVYDTQQRKLDASIDAVDGGWARFFGGGH